MEKYITPKMEMIEFILNDIITTSEPVIDAGSLEGNSLEGNSNDRF